MLADLAAEGVYPWLVWDDALPPGPEVTRQGWRGMRMSPGAPLAAVRAACDVLRDVDGFVSMPVGAPADRREASPGDWIASARVLRGGVDRPNLLVGLPADATGIRALVGCLEEGISVDSSPCYTVEQYAEVLDAQLTGLERALSAGVEPSAPVVAASCAVGVLDAEVDVRLTRLSGGEPHTLHGTAGPATAQLIYRLREKRLAGARWRALSSAGARLPKLVWTDTGSGHIPALVGWNTGHALTAEMAEAAAVGGGLRGDTLLGCDAPAARALDALAGQGVQVAAVGAELLRRHRQGLSSNCRLPRDDRP
ncbi:hypothetical protein WQO_24515 [Streptomyces globisporus C-1027]|uniref:Transaldolase n=1 Tax=Streptomyces globisporus C-1027 TaxID=1172567 RepID=A0A0U3KB59_STRGL|nr:hypothetical protein WQO_24515 [Streptomyces globisporus C-1027]